MIILGMDPGTARVGFGIIEQRDVNKISPIIYGCIKTKSGLNEKRLKYIYEETLQLIRDYRPEALSLEKLFFNTNIKTASSVGEARGVIILAASQSGLKTAEYTPLEVKQAVVGYGRALKMQIQEMVRILLNLKEIPRSDDAADALAIAICHAHCFRLKNLVESR